MTPLKYVLSFPRFLGVAELDALNQITINRDQFLAEGYQNAKIVDDNQLFSHTCPDEKIVSGLLFGLIACKCDKYARQLISIFDHKGCNFYGFYDQGEDEERSNSDSILFYHCILYRVLYYAYTMIFLISLFGRFLFRYPRGLHSKFLDSRFYRPKNTDWGPNRNIPIPCDGGKGAIRRETKQDKTSNFTNVNETFTRYKKKHRCPDAQGKKGLPTVISGLLLIKIVGACDITIHVNFNGFKTICVGTDCQNNPLHTFSLTLGQEVCFEDEVGFMKMSISEIKIRSRYELKYYTSDYRIANLSSEGECLGLKGNHASRHDLCGAPGRLCDHEKLTALSVDQEQSSENSHRGSMCEFEEKLLYNEFPSLDGYTHTYYPCCRYSWLVESAGKLYPVYSRVGQIWMVKLTTTQNGYAQEIELNAYDPTRTLEGFNLSTNETITLTVLDAKLDTSSTHNALLLHDDFIYRINASEIYKPQPELFGDIQVPLKKDKLIFSPPKYGICVHDGPVEYTGVYEQTCTCQCTLPASKINSFLNNLENFYTLKDYIMRKNDSSVIDTFEKFDEGLLDVKMGEWNINDLPTKKAKCDIEYVESSGCKSCNKSSYIILTSRNVATEGIVPFYSNCSFDKHYLKCDLVEELKLVLKENYRTCYLKMPTLNKSMLINMEYLNISHSFNQMEAKEITAIDEQGFSCIVMNGMFTKTVIIMLILSSILSLMYSIIFTFLVFKDRKKKVENETATALVEI